MSTVPQTLPLLSAQDSINEVLTDAHSNSQHAAPEEFWVEIDGHEVRFSATPNPKLQSKDSKYHAVVTPEALQMELYKDSRFAGQIRFGRIAARFPKNTIRVTCADVFENLVLVGGDNGLLKLLDLSSDDVIGGGDLEGHVLHTSLARFFPSGKVALSAGMDFSMKLWDLNTNTMIEKLVCQKGVIDDVVLIGRGRNLLSLCTATSDVALWEVSRPEVLQTYHFSSANCLSIWTDSNVSPTSAHPPYYDTDGKLGLIGTDHAIKTLDLRMKSPVIVRERPCSKLSIVGNTLVSSYEDVVSIADIRMPAHDVMRLTSDQGTIRDLRTTESKIFIHTNEALYAYEYASNASEVLCSESYGAISVYNGELWHIGNEIIRRFPF